MRIQLIPPNEDLRLHDLYSYDILDSEEEEDFNNLLEVATHICQCPIAAITFIDEDRQWIKSGKNINFKTTKREDGICAHTILGKNVMIVNDTSLDERFVKNPFVDCENGIRFYAGAPIVSGNGYNLGTVCVIDNQPRELDPEQIKILSILSGHVSKLLDLRLKNKVLKQRSEEYIQMEKLLLQKTMKDHEVERSFISTELHENIAQSLAATRFYLDLAEGSDESKDEWIRKSKANLHDLIDQVSNLSKAILPTTMKTFELKDILQTLLDQFSDQTQIKTTLYYEGHDDFNPETSITIYRIVEEQLKNVKQHSKATQVTVIMNVFQNASICIRDNGVGIDLKSFQKGTGFNQILSRIDGLNGTMDIGGYIGRGSELTAVIPLNGRE
ncbi:GAF domain-containing sensor histidine kinase [Flavitalea antarctica]